MDEQARWAAPETHEQLLASIKAALPDLETLAGDIDRHGTAEDLIYRFWHQSFKVFWLQDVTSRIVAALEALSPDGSALDDWFTAIVAEGTGRTFTLDDNGRWLVAARPIVEAYFHARFMLDMALRYGRELDLAPSLLPSGWAALLHLYKIR
jgi:hypothetical protein